MTPWFLSRPDRLDRERLALQELAASAAWLQGFEWQWLQELSIEAVIEAHGIRYTVRVTFPGLFPDAPIIVRPLNETQRLSPHQYGGADGALCLEWGPDNWHPDVTAAAMLESAHRLLDAESPRGDQADTRRREVPSRHRLTTGQELRSAWSRWLVSPRLLTILSDKASRSSTGSFRFSLRDLGKSWGILVHEVSGLDGDALGDSSIPADLPGATKQSWFSGAWVKTSHPAVDILGAKSLGDLQGLLVAATQRHLLNRDGSSPIPGFDQSPRGLLIGDDAGEWHFFLNFSDESLARAMPVCARVDTPRTPTRLRASLVNAKIAIVGLGSVGSKVAMSLVRSGAGELYLIDHDVLLPENLERHALDWQSVTSHKAEAVARATSFVNPLVKVETEAIDLTGQESSAIVNKVLTKLGLYDVLVDATAEPRAFNQLAAISRRSQKPLVWVEVFAGGVGGVVARSRPGFDPSPQTMRLAYLSYCNDHPPPPDLINSARYDEVTASGVLSASDADVSILAHHAVRMACDCLLPGGESAFPHSMYLVGLATAWVFEAPFSTIPIATSGIADAEGDSGEPVVLKEDTIRFLADLLENGPK